MSFKPVTRCPVRWRALPTSPRSSRSLPAVIHDEKIKDLCLHHAGTVASQRAAGAAAPFVLRERCSTKTGEPAYATLDASAGPLQHEIFPGSLEPSLPLRASSSASVPPPLRRTA